MMDDLAITADPPSGSQRLPVIVIVNDQVLPRSCIVNILKRELAGFEIAEMATTGDLDHLSGRDIRLIAFNMGDTEIADPSVEDRLSLIEELCPNAHVALLSNRDDEATATAAMQTWRSVAFFRARFRSRSRSRDCALSLPAASTDRCRSSARMARRAPDHTGMRRRPDLSAVRACNGFARLVTGANVDRPDAARATRAGSVEARSSEQADRRPAQPFGKHRQDAHPAHHAEMPCA